MVPLPLTLPLEEELKQGDEETEGELDGVSEEIADDDALEDTDTLAVLKLLQEGLVLGERLELIEGDPVGDEAALLVELRDDEEDPVTERLLEPEKETVTLTEGEVDTVTLRDAEGEPLLDTEEDEE